MTTQVATRRSGVTAAGRLVQAEALFAQISAGYVDLCAKHPDVAEWVFYDGERVFGVEAAAQRAEQYVGFSMRTLFAA